ncbi:MAG: RNA polymerase sporulation sigma factor SigK [Clostridia bacterium]|nr:RNA polymerase sporulation sigma factor SigK [Clostridia bacterium]
MFWQIFFLLSKFAHVILGVSTPQSFPPPLGKEEETALFLAAAKGDAAAREKLILHNLRLVAHIVRKYYPAAKDQEDLVSIGSIGLVKAVDSFRVENGARFATYAAKCIQNEILMHFRSRKKLCAEVSLGETIDVDRDGNPLTYIYVICSDENVCEDVDTKLQIEKAMRLVETALTPREQQIVIMRYGLYGHRAATQREVASLLGISRSYVSRIEKSALEKLADGFKRRP